jgi:hypothetical protein
MDKTILIDTFLVLALRGMDIAAKLNRGEEITDADLALTEDFNAALERLRKEKEGT